MRSGADLHPSLKAIFVPVRPDAANGSVPTSQSSEGGIRRALIEADFVDAALRDSAFRKSEGQYGRAPRPALLEPLTPGENASTQIESKTIEHNPL